MYLDSFYNDFRNDSFFVIEQYYRQTRFTDKIQTRAYTLDDLIGTCGGYIGLFLGYALIQFPQLMEFTFQVLKRVIFARKTRKINQNTYPEDLEPSGEN